MTTHDYPSEPHRTGARVDPATASTNPGSGQPRTSTTADSSVSPTAATDPGWQRHADEFAANRGEPAGAGPSPAQAESAISSDAGSEGLDDDYRSSAQSSTDTSLFPDAELAEMRRGWDSVQAGFVDDPKRCVEQADGLVADFVEQLSSGFAKARSRLEQQWSRGEEASTEDLRIALKRYREFFDRLLAV
jgi:hypothetical protein